MSKFKRTWEEILAAQNADAPARRHYDDEEHRIQSSCIEWVSWRHPELYYCLFDVPNGGARNKATAGRLKAEGVKAGVADLLMLKANKHYHGLCIEMKTQKGRQSEAQKEWQRNIEREGYKYIICRSLEEFINEIEAYLNDV